MFRFSYAISFLRKFVPHVWRSRVCVPRFHVCGAWTNSRAHKRPDSGARMSLSPPLPPPTSPPKSDDGSLNLLIPLLIFLVVLVIGEWKTKFFQRQWDMSRQSRDPWAYLTEKSVELAEDAPQRKTPALFTKFMEADRLDIVAQDTESQKSTAISDKVSKKIKERRENPTYLPQTMNSAKCYIDSDRSTGEDWGFLGPKLLQRCKETNGRLILLMTPECKKVQGQEQWVGEPRLTHQQEKLKQMAIGWGVDVREIEIRAGDAHEKVMTLVNTNVMMEKEKARQFMAADCVHVLSTQYKDKVAFELARQADAILDGMPRTFCYNPNEESRLVADNDSTVANNMWLEIFENMVEHATASTSQTNKKRRGKVFQLIMDGQQTSMQFSEEKLAKKYGVELVKITVDASWTKERLRPILMEAHARA